MGKAAHRVLLIVDPQNDFIFGSLAVSHAAVAMDYLTSWLEEHHSELSAVVVTQDQHPEDHCSFTDQGGIWPRHCVADTEGAAVYSPLQQALDLAEEDGLPVYYIGKAYLSDREAYSAFEEELPEVLLKADEIYISGIAGDYCVRHTVADIRRHDYTGRLTYLWDAIPFINESARDQEAP